MKFVVFIVIFFVVGSSVSWTLSNYGHPYFPLTDPEFNEIKKIPEVKAFYEKHRIVSVYYLDHEIIDKEKGIRSDDKFRIVFSAVDTGVIVDQLEMYYFAWIPYF